MKKLILATLIITFILPGVALADDSLYRYSKERALLRAKLLETIDAEKVDEFLFSTELSLDDSVIIKGITGKGFDYFSDSFGLVTKKTLKDGLDYRAKNWNYFKKARQTYGVDSYYILGIIRLESYFGQHKPKRSVANSLYSVFILDPDRRNFSSRELSQFLRITDKRKIPTFSVKGSVAGAFGIPQFIPTSYSAFAVDGNGDGKVDLFNNADAIISVGKYLKDNGWGATEAEKRKAIYAYNHDQGYVNAVMAYAEAIQKEVERMFP